MLAKEEKIQIASTQRSDSASVRTSPLSPR